MASELKPCPFCGSSNVEMMRYHGLFGVECRDCFRPSWTYYATIKTAVEQWNRRDDDGKDELRGLPALR